MDNDCLFCGIVRGDIPCERVYEDADILAFEDVEPRAPLHILCIPKKHIGTMNDAVEEDDLLLGRMMRVLGSIAREKGVSDEGYRIVINCNRGAGQAVFHLHAHLLGGRDLTWPPG
jgi:histidine triad (HIT) family protein